MTSTLRSTQAVPSILATGIVPRATKPRFTIPAIALFAGAALFAGHAARAANTEYDVITGQTDLTAPTTYTTGGTAGTGAGGTVATTGPTVTSDVTFDSGTAYSPAAFTLNSSLTFGSLNDLSTTAITIDNTSSTADTLTLGGTGDLGDGVGNGSVAGDLLFVGTGASLNIGSASTSALGLVLGQSGNFDVVGTAAISSVISGGTGIVLTKTGAGTLTLSGANTYSGATNITAGMLALSGGNDRLLNTGTVNFTGTGTLNLSGAISQTLGNITVANNVTGTVTGTTGTLTLTGAAFAVGGTGTAQTLDLSGLGTFNYNNAAGTFTVGGTATTAASAGTVKLAPVSTIIAKTVNVGIAGGTSGSGELGQGTVNLGATATINANTIQLGGGQSQGTINYAVSTASPTLTLRGSDGSSRVTNLTIGQSATFVNTENSTVDLTTNVTGTSTLDAMVGTLTIGNFLTRGTNPSSTPIVNASLLMGGGTLDATTIIIGQNAANPYLNGNLITTNGTLTVTGGTVKAQTLSLGNQNNNTTGTTAGANSTVTGTFNLNGGANLYAGTINSGTGTGNRPATRTFNWNAGTIHNYDANTDLIINSLASTGATSTFALLGAGAHTFNIDANRQGAVAQVISGTGTGGLTKAGLGTLTLSGANTYTGATMVTGGTLGLANTTGLALSGTASVAVNNGGTLLFSNSNQVKTTAPITLGTAAVAGPPAVAATTGLLSVAAGASQGTAATVTGGSVTGTAPNGGSITTGGTATGTTTAGLGALTLSNTATLTFGGGSTTLVFGTFTPNGNVLTVTGYMNNGATTTGSSGMGTDDRLVFSGNQSANLTDFNFGSGAGVGVSEIALDNGFYEVTAAAVPEPSTYVGGLMLLVGMAWTYRRQRQALRS